MKTFPPPSARRARRRLLLVTLGALAGVVACDDPFEIKAQSPTLDRTFELWALNGSPASYPTGVIVAQGAAVPVDAAGSFDLAFDITAGGLLQVLPVSRVVSPVTGARVVEFQRGVVSYDALLEAPKNGWTADTVLTLDVGDVFLVRATTLYCQYDIRQQVYGKFLVDSVLTAERRIKLTARVNPNCGFRSLLTGIPEF